MKNKFKKKLKIRLFGAIIVIITISFTSFVGCDYKKLAKGEAENKEIVAEKTSENKEIGTTAIKEQNDSIKPIQKDNKSVEISESRDKKSNLIEYIGLIGLSKEKLISTLEEKPSLIDEGGLEFKKTGIRVWLDKKNNTQVEQVLVMRNDIDLNGAKIGDKISKFKEVFGNTISDKNGDAHFKYNDIFLSVNYDTTTGETYGVYILKNDF